jgi:hypothetical protein
MATPIHAPILATAVFLTLAQFVNAQQVLPRNEIHLNPAAAITEPWRRDAVVLKRSITHSTKDMARTRVALRCGLGAGQYWAHGKEYFSYDEGYGKYQWSTNNRFVQVAIGAELQRYSKSKRWRGNLAVESVFRKTHKSIRYKTEEASFPGGLRRLQGVSEGSVFAYGGRASLGFAFFARPWLSIGYEASVILIGKRESAAVRSTPIPRDYSYNIWGDFLDPLSLLSIGVHF